MKPLTSIARMDLEAWEVAPDRAADLVTTETPSLVVSGVSVLLAVAVLLTPC